MSKSGDALQASLLEKGQEVPQCKQVPVYRLPAAAATAGVVLLVTAAVYSVRAPPAALTNLAINAPSFVVNSPTNAPPFFRIVAKSAYDAGYQHGALAQPRIHAWFASVEMRSIFDWVAGDGREAFAQMKRDNTAEFPNYVEEMRGIADGADVTLDQVWVANMINDLENLMAISHKATPRSESNKQKGCSDEYVVSQAGYAAGFGHGHNDDWSAVARQYWYLLSVSATPGARNLHAHCAGVAYPGTMVGWAPTWNEHGMYHSQNTLLPRKSRAGGLALTFVQKRAICSANGMDAYIAEVTRPGWSDGASMNVVDTRGGRMANIELWEDRHSVLEITPAMGNYSHFNEYKHLETAKGRPVDNPLQFVRDLRQSRVDSLPAPRTTHDIMARLSDPVVYSKNGTLLTTVLNGTTGQLDIWCCGVPAMHAPSKPVYSLNLNTFF